MDFLTKKRIKNNGVVPQYYVENSHDGIIPKEIFMQVQEELVAPALRPAQFQREKAQL